MARKLLSVDLTAGRGDLGERLESAAERTGREKSEIAKAALSAMLAHVEQTGTLEGGMVSVAEYEAIRRFRGIARAAGAPVEELLSELTGVLAPIAEETGQIPRPIAIRRGGLDARAERISGQIAVLRRNLRELEQMLD